MQRALILTKVTTWLPIVNVRPATSSFLNRLSKSDIADRNHSFWSTYLNPSSSNCFLDTFIASCVSHFHPHSLILAKANAEAERTDSSFSTPCFTNPPMASSQIPDSSREDKGEDGGREANTRPMESRDAIRTHEPTSPL